MIKLTFPNGVLAPANISTPKNTTGIKYTIKNNAIAPAMPYAYFFSIFTHLRASQVKEKLIKKPNKIRVGSRGGIETGNMPTTGRKT